jgi:hypothetical protein
MALDEDVVRLAKGKNLGRSLPPRGCSRIALSFGALRGYRHSRAPTHPVLAATTWVATRMAGAGRADSLDLGVF